MSEDRNVIFSEDLEEAMRRQAEMDAWDRQNSGWMLKAIEDAAIDLANRRLIKFPESTGFKLYGFRVDEIMLILKVVKDRYRIRPGMTKAEIQHQLGEQDGVRAASEERRTE